MTKITHNLHRHLKTANNLGQYRNDISFNPLFPPTFLQFAHFQGTFLAHFSLLICPFHATKAGQVLTGQIILLLQAKVAKMCLYFFKYFFLFGKKKEAKKNILSEGNLFGKKIDKNIHHSFFILSGQI